MHSVIPIPEDFHQLELLFTDPVQYNYEAVRPTVFGFETVAARSERTGIDRTTLGEKARNFIQHGMFGLVDHRKSNSGRKDHQFPEAIAGYILYLKQLYPPIHYREIVRILESKYGYKTNHHTVKNFLDKHAVPVQLPLRWKTFHEFEQAYQARVTVAKMYYQGWQPESIAGCLKLSRKHVWHIVREFKRGGFVGLEDQRTRPVDHPANQLTLPMFKDILDIQREYPRAGRFRVQGLLEQRTGSAPSEATVGRAMATNRRQYHAPPAWITDNLEVPDGEWKHLPYEPLYRHRYWYVDLRYLVRLSGRAWTYSLCIIEGHSRKILAGMASDYQDVVAVLQLLAAAIREYGSPEGIVSDNGSVFTSDAYTQLLADLGVEACYIEKGRPYQNLIESQFKIELRLADAKFESSQTLEEIQARHAEFVETFNTTPHWAHRERDDGLRTPVDVLAWVRGRAVDPGKLERSLKQLSFERTVNQSGYVSVQRFYIYAERGLARSRVSIWLYEGNLRIAYQQALLAKYTYRYSRDSKRLHSVRNPSLYSTEFTSPQLELWELDDEQWRKVMKLPEYQPRTPQSRHPIQELLFSLDQKRYAGV